MTVKTTVLVAAVSVALTVGLVRAQSGAQAPPQNPPPQNPPAQNPPAQPPAANQPVAPPKDQPPKPFPEGAKIAFIDLQTIASNSAEGKAASAKLQEFTKKKDAEIAEKNKQAQALQTKLQQGGTVLSEQARAQSEKELQKLARELQNLQEDRNRELQELTETLQLEFQKSLNPIIDQLANEKGLHMVISARDSGILWAYSGIDLSAEVIKRFDAASKTAPVKK